MYFLKIPAVRWIVMLPAAVLAAMIAVLLVRLVNIIWVSGDPDQLTFFGLLERLSIVPGDLFLKWLSWRIGHLSRDAFMTSLHQDLYN